jgi:hypothetical protein
MHSCWFDFLVFEGGTSMAMISFWFGFLDFEDGVGAGVGSRCFFFNANPFCVACMAKASTNCRNRSVVSNRSSLVLDASKLASMISLAVCPLCVNLKVKRDHMREKSAAIVKRSDLIQILTLEVFNNQEHISTYNAVRSTADNSNAWLDLRAGRWRSKKSISNFVFFCDSQPAAMGHPFETQGLSPTVYGNSTISNELNRTW